MSATQIDESAPTLSSLAPEYSFDAHGVYFTILKTAIDAQPAVHNIALAGTYGAGKSSILWKVADEYPDRVVELSLLTLGAQPGAVHGEESNPAAASTTNRSQKEIVKQLLYQQRPANAPESRFHRIVRMRWRVELLIAGVAAAVAVILALIAGLDVIVSPSLGLTLVGRPHGFVVAALFSSLAVIAGLIVFALRALMRGRAAIEKVSAGPATITLPPRSASYFDEYLDEIIYFFETNSRRDIVIIEDLDRFNDANIFESLRSLNGLLNAAQQLGKRDIRFIYAVRDSVFERLGRDATAATSDDAKAELARANRTKFFELVVPVVPFITHKNARDLMSELLDARGHGVSKDLVDLAARHLADMRLIHNIVNEYEVFKHRLLDVATPVPELDPDRLFAMIVFKNAHIGDFEKIRHGESSLDLLWGTWRALVLANIGILREESRDLRTLVAGRTDASNRAQDIGGRVRAFIDALATAPGSAFVSAEIHYAGAIVSDAELQSPEFWHGFIDADAPLAVEANGPVNSYSTQHMQFGQNMLEMLIGGSLNVAEFEEDQAAHAEERLEQIDGDVALLQRHSWAQLAAEPRFGLTRQGEGTLSFQGWVERLLPSQLAADLVLHGYITSYFPLHVSMFYGNLIHPDAMTYVMRFVDHGQADPDYPLAAADVEAILRDQGNSVLVERSMFNVGILDHLLAARQSDAATVIASLVNTGAQAMTFVERYLESGSRKPEFIALLTPRLGTTFTFLSQTPTVDEEERVALLDTAIVNRRTEFRYQISERLRSLVLAVYQELPSLTPTAQRDVAEATVMFIADLGVVVPSVSGLHEAAVSAFKETRAYALTRENLELVTGSDELSLESLAAAGGGVAQYAMDSPADYAAAVQESASTRYAVHSTELLLAFLKSARSANLVAVDALLALTGPQCTVENLTEASVHVWGSIVRSRLASMSYANVTSYIGSRREVDDDLGTSLASVQKIEDADAATPGERVELALAILNAPATTLNDRHRVVLARSLDPGVLLAERIEPRPGALIGDLLAAGLIADDETAFSPRLMVDWDTQRHAVAHSANFSTFVGPATLDAKYIALLLRDEHLPKAYLPVARALRTYRSVPAEARTAYAERALAGGYSLPPSILMGLRQLGVSEALIIELVAKYLPKVTHDDLRDILRTLDKPWSKVADPGFGIAEIPDSPAAQKILKALSAARVVSKYPLRDGRLRVSMRHK